MEFRIADTFTESLSKLTGEEQKAVKTTAFDLQLNPANPGMSFHRLDGAKDKNFWSIRVNRDIRIIAHKSEASLLLCYVDHHDNAYNWAVRRKLETHPKTGAAQIVEIRETVQEILVPVHVDCPISTKFPLFSKNTDDELLGYGIPIEWMEDVRRVSNEDELLSLAEHLPAEAAEALLELAIGGKPRPAISVTFASSFDHPDAQRRFRIMSSVEELQRALDFPWEKWTVFLHPEQRHWVERDYNGPARVTGSAGTGKTIVALHRAAYLARKNEDSRVLLTTFSDTLANALNAQLKRLLSNEPRLIERIDVHSLEEIAKRLYKGIVTLIPPKIADQSMIKELLREASQEVLGHKFTLSFLLSEWEQVVDAWQLTDWEGYRDVARLGRKTGLSESQRKILWQIFDRVKNQLKVRALITWAELFTILAEKLSERTKAIFDFAVIDEAQDVGISHMRFLVALGKHREDSLFFAGDIGQRIFQQSFSWKSLGADVRGRSRTLRVNYRTSHQIRSQADRLLEPSITDFDGNIEVRNDTISVFNGQQPVISIFDNEIEEISSVAKWLTDCSESDFKLHEMAVFVRSDAQLLRAQAALEEASLAFNILDKNVEILSDHVSISTMHYAKGLEFRAVVVMACDDEIIPSQERLESAGDDSDLQEIYDTERHLLYVACTRARDRLFITGVHPGSEFLNDMSD